MIRFISFLDRLGIHMHITLRQIHIFMAIYQQGSTTQAAKTLSLSQSAISTALSELEAQLNTPLFDRVGRRLLINNAGKLLASKAQNLLDQAQEIEQLFNTHPITLQIGASTTIGNYLLPKIIAEFIHNYANINIALHVHNSEHIIKGINDLKYDLGFIEGLPPVHYPHIKHTPWKEDELILFSAIKSQYISTTHPSIAQLQQAPLILREAGSGTRAIIEQQFLDHIQIPQIIEIGHSEAIKQSVLYDLGVGCLSTFVINDLIQQQKIQKLEVNNLKISRTLWKIQHLSKHISPALQTFINFIVTH